MPVGGERFRLTHPESAEALFDQRDFERDERIPYWADLWPSARGLARHLHKLDLTGKRALELGCGVGLPSIVAASRGADVTATDHYAPALDFAAYNAYENTGKTVATRLLDWHHPDTEDLGPFDLVLAADVLYEKGAALALADLVPRLIGPGGAALVADPGRRYEPLFREKIKEAGFVFRTDERSVENDDRAVTVLIHDISRKAGA